jgi:putative Mn2+ efflux pump MntP
MVLGLPLSLSLDNLIAGTTLGMIGFPILLSVMIIGLMSSVLSLTGLRLGHTAINLLRIRADLIGGVVLIFIAITFVIEDLF